MRWRGRPAWASNRLQHPGTVRSIFQAEIRKWGKVIRDAGVKPE
jgi:hypothetical protein